MHRNSILNYSLAVAFSLMLISCGGGGGGPGNNSNTYSIGGNVSGLIGSGLVLQLNGSETITINSNGAFSFTTALSDLSSFDVSVSVQPISPSQNCSVSNGFGDVSGANITDVAITCITNSFTVSGSVTGLSGSGLELQLYSDDIQSIVETLIINGNGSFGFSSSITDLTGYGISVRIQPSQQGCFVQNARGIFSGSDISDVQVNCNINRIGELYRARYQATATQGNFTYVAAFGLLHVIDISTPSNPLLISSLETPYTAVDVAANGDFIYVADNLGGLRIIDISTPASPVEVGFSDTFFASGGSINGAVGVSISGNYAYVANSTSGLRILDISNPASPVETGFYDSPDFAQGVYVRDNYAYLADGSSGLRIIDVSNPA